MCCDIMHYASHTKKIQKHCLVHWQCECGELLVVNRSTCVNIQSKSGINV